MARFFLRGSVLKILPLVSFCLMASTCLFPPIALAQHGGGGHGGGGHFGGGAHMSAPRGSAAPVAHGATSRSRSFAPVPYARFGPNSFRFRPTPIRPFPRRFPIFGYPGFFGAPFFWFGGFNSFWWPPCGPFWGPGCGFSPFYGYGGYGDDYGDYYGNAWPSYVSPAPIPTPNYSYSPYAYGEGRRDLVELYFKDGTVYDVTDYWMIDGQLHFTTIDEAGTKSVLHVVPFDQLDLQTTVDVNTQRGFRFTLRNEPVEEYLRSHPTVPTPEPEPRPRD